MRRSFYLVLLAYILAFPAMAAEEEKVSMDFVNVDIAVVVKYISELTGKNFIIDDKVSGKVTIISPQMLTKEEAYTVFESILETYGFVAIPVGKVIKISPLSEARHKATRVQVGTKPTRQMRDQMITQLIPLKYISAQNLLAVIRPLISSTSYIAAYTPTNTLILVDLAANRTRIMKIIQQLDVKGFESAITLVRLEYASAIDLADKIEVVLSEKGRKVKKEFPSKVIADDRLNALIIVGNDLYVSRVNSLVEQLDVEAPPGRQEINVIYLKNADAEELAKVISKIAESATALKAKKTTRTRKTGRAEDKIVVTADQSTNSLVITASPEDFKTLKDVIEKLDIRRGQVFVEALIFEIRTDMASRFGIEWRTTADFNQPGLQGFGGTNFGGISAAAINPLEAGQGLVLGVVDGTISFGGQKFLNIGALVHALQTESGINILSTPNLLTTDNVEAEIFVGENVPFIKGTTVTSTGIPTTSIERKDVGMLLRIKPRINPDDYVTLEITQEFSSISPIQLAKASDLITFERRAQTTTTVKNHQNVIIGGLLREDKSESVNKVPFFGDIPLLGWLFRNKTTQKVKNNLLMFITPHIIRTDADMESITDEKQKRMDDKQKEEEKKETPETEEKAVERENDTPQKEKDEKIKEEKPAVETEQLPTPEIEAEEEKGKEPAEEKTAGEEKETTPSTPETDIIKEKRSIKLEKLPGPESGSRGEEVQMIASIEKTLKAETETGNNKGISSGLNEKSKGERAGKEITLFGSTSSPSRKKAMMKP